MNRSSIQALALTSGMVLALVGGAQAAQISFTSVSANWHSPADNLPGSQTGEPVISNGTPMSSINWGTGATQSGYDFTRSVPGTQTLPPAPTPFFPLGTFAHRNFPVGDPSLTSVKLDVVLLLNVDGTATGPLTFTFIFNHDETDNNQNPCPYTTPSGEGCTDRVSFVSSPQPTTFRVDGVDYTLSMSFVDGNGSPVAEFITREGRANTANLVGRFTVPPTAPVLSSLTPNTTMAGSPTFTMLVNGSNFLNGAVVSWNGSNLATGFVNANQLSATVAASRVAAAGSANVRVTNPDSLQSAALPFTITPPSASVLTSIKVIPSSATLATGASLQFSAKGYDQYNVEMSGIQFNWTITGSNTLSSAGPSLNTTVTAGNSPGSYVLTATNSGISGRANIVVQGGPVVGGLYLIDPASANPNPVPGRLTQLHVLAGSSNAGPITYRWDFVGLAAIISNPNSNDSPVTFTQPGSYYFVVTITDSQGLQLVTGVSVPVVRTVTRVVVMPADIVMLVGQSHPFSATAVDQFDQPISTTYQWSATAGIITGAGTFSSMAPLQNVTITARAPNGVFGIARLRVQGSGVGSGAMDLSQAKAYPVPYKSSGGTPGITFSGLTAGTTIRVFTSDGRLVVTLHSEGTNVLWPVTNMDGERLASSVYFYKIENTADQKKEGKLVIIQ